MRTYEKSTRTRCIGLDCYSSCYEYQAPATGSPGQVWDNTLVGQTTMLDHNEDRAGACKAL
jgi:hypothetical protein